jgi:hypothetical protein
MVMLPPLVVAVMTFGEDESVGICPWVVPPAAG